MANKLSWIRAFMLLGTLMKEFSEASADGIITVDEALKGVAELAKAAGLVFDDKGAAFVVNLITKIFDASADNKITLGELIAIGEEVCIALGIDLDKTITEVPAISGSTPIATLIPEDEIVK